MRKAAIIAIITLPLLTGLVGLWEGKRLAEASECRVLSEAIDALVQAGAIVPEAVMERSRQLGGCY